MVRTHRVRGTGRRWASEIEITGIEGKVAKTTWCSGRSRPVERSDEWCGLAGKQGKRIGNRGERATNRNREHGGELARARPCVTHSDRGPSHPDARPSANMPRGWPTGNSFRTAQSARNHSHSVAAKDLS